MLNYRLEPLGTVEGFTAEVGASGSFCPSHLTLPVDVLFYSVSDDNAPSPYMVSSLFSCYKSNSYTTKQNLEMKLSFVCERLCELLLYACL